MKQRRTLNRTSVRPHPAFTAILATLIAAAVVAAAMFAGNRVLHVQSIAPANIDVYTDTDSFAAGTDITIDDAAVRTQGGDDEDGRRVVKEFTREREFSMFALTWSGDRDIVAYVRSQRDDGTWSPWYLMDHADSQDGATRFGTEPIYVEPTTRVQVSTGNVDLLEDGRATSDAPTTANDLEAVFIDGGSGTVDGDIKQVADSYTYAMPKVITRAQWGAGASSNPTYTEPVTSATIHHTAGSNNYSEAEAPGVVRGIWSYHAKTLGWGDVGYNALVDKYGNIYEGRAGGLDRAVEGAHVGGFNQNTWGVSVLGNYQTAQPSDKAINALGEIIGWKAAVAGFDPTGSDYHRAEFSFKGSRYAKGQGATLPNINAHRDFHYNECPGDNLYARMGDIRNAAKVKYDAVKATSTTADPAQPNPGENTSTPESGTNDSVDNPDGSTTTVTHPDTQQTPTSSLGTSLSGLLSEEASAVVAAAGTVAGLLLVYAYQHGMLTHAVENVAGVELLSGLTVEDIAPYVGPVLQFIGGNEVADVWYTLEPSLGTTSGAIAGVGGSEIAFYSGGLGVRDEAGTIFELKDKIADAWLQQGLDAGPLGLPISVERTTPSDEVRMDFQGGAIVYDPTTNTVNIITD